MAAPLQAVATNRSYARTGMWGHGLCGCFDNLEICIIAYFVPCVTFGQTAEFFGKDCCMYGCLYVLWPFNWYLEMRQRGELRAIRGIPGSGCGDCCTICWCSFCTLVQEAQEVQTMRNETANVVIVTSQQMAASGMAYSQPYAHTQPQAQAMDRKW